MQIDVTKLVHIYKEGCCALCGEPFVPSDEDMSDRLLCSGECVLLALVPSTENTQ
jgi:hypothetical protein